MKFENLSFRQMEYVVTLAAEKNFTRAAEKLYITQPSLSQAIKNIEDENEITLFVREKRKIYPTEEGQLLIKSAESILQTVRDLNTQLNQLSRMKQKTLIIGAGFTLGNVFLSRMIGEFRRIYPNVSISLVEDTSTALEHEASEGKIDIAFVLRPVSNSQLNNISVASGDIIIGMSSSNPLTAFSVPAADGGLRLFDIENAKEASFVRFIKGGRIETLIAPVLNDCHFSPKDSIRVRNVSSAIDIIAESNDIVILPDIYSKSARLSSECSFFRIKGTLPKWDLAAVSAMDYASMPAIAKEFIDLLTARSRDIRSR